MLQRDTLQMDYRSCCTLSPCPSRQSCNVTRVSTPFQACVLEWNSLAAPGICLIDIKHSL